jgi:hypothetical protein
MKTVRSDSANRVIDDNASDGDIGATEETS